MVSPSGWAVARMQHIPPHFSSTPRSTPAFWPREKPGARWCQRGTSKKFRGLAGAAKRSFALGGDECSTTGASAWREKRNFAPPKHEAMLQPVGGPVRGRDGVATRQRTGDHYAPQYAQRARQAPDYLPGGLPGTLACQTSRPAGARQRRRQQRKKPRSSKARRGLCKNPWRRPTFPHDDMQYHRR